MTRSRKLERKPVFAVVVTVLFFGWLASRLDWKPGTLMEANGAVRGRAHGHRDDVELTLEPNAQQSVPGLTGVEIHTSSGTSISLDRGPGGRRRGRDARRRARRRVSGRERTVSGG